MEIKDKAKNFLRLCAAGNVKAAYDQYTSQDFIHHNPHFAGDAESLLKGMEENAQKFPNKVCEILRCAQEGDTVFTHSKVTFNETHRDNKTQPAIAVVHIFKFRDGRIKELWDIGQPVPEDIVNEHGMF